MLPAIRLFDNAHRVHKAARPIERQAVEPPGQSERRCSDLLAK